MGLLDGKVAIVTGAGRGIGREEALLLASEGAKVIVNDVGASVQGEGGDKHPAEEVVDPSRSGGQRGGGQLLRRQLMGGGQGPGRPGRGHVRSTRHPGQQRRNPAGQDELQHGGVGLGRCHPGPPEGPLAPTHHAAVHWRGRAKAGETVSGHIINTSSEAGLYGNAGQANYSAAKAGIASMTWVLARELERYGITVNSISPRARTRMTENLFGRWPRPPRASTSGISATSPSWSASWPRRGGRHHRSELHRVRRQHLGDRRVPPGRRDPPGLDGTPKELADAKGELFKGISSGIPSSASSKTGTGLRTGWVTTAVACPTTFSSPSALSRRTSRSTRCSPPSSRVPVTTILVSSFSAGQVCLAKRTWKRRQLPDPHVVGERGAQQPHREHPVAERWAGRRTWRSPRHGASG